MIISLTWLKSWNWITFYDTVNSFENHNHIGKIKAQYKDKLSPEFEEFRANELLEAIKQLLSSKVIVLNDIQIKKFKS